LCVANHCFSPSHDDVTNRECPRSLGDPLRPMLAFNLCEKESEAPDSASCLHLLFCITLGYASRHIADVIPSVRDGMADGPLVGIPFDSNFAGLQVHNGLFDARYGLDGLGHGLGAVAAGHTLDIELQHACLLDG
jgi:hypothetical protein